MESVRCEKCFLLNAICLVLCISQCYCAQFTSKRQTFCPPDTDCQPLSTCPILNNILNNECVLRNRIDNLSCGYQGSGLVCCPNIARSSRRDFNDGSFNQGNFNQGSFNQGSTVDSGCGLSQVLGDNYTGLGAFPFVARVGFKNVATGDVKYPCAGSIVGDRIILTAAHCALAKADNYKLFHVRVGEFSTDSEFDCGEEFCGLPAQDISISHVVVHPGYDKTTFKDDIALIVLTKKIKYTVTTQPVCLPELWSNTDNNAVLVGWGKTSNQQSETPSNQQVLALPIVSNDRCNIYGKLRPVSDDKLCAGGDYGKDACSGFLGCPLLVKQGVKYYQVGILSYGATKCGTSGIPSVYINVKKYADWIKENTPVVFDN